MRDGWLAKWMLPRFIDFPFPSLLHPFLETSGLVEKWLVRELVPRPDPRRPGFVSHGPVRWNRSPNVSVVYFLVCKVEIIIHHVCGEAPGDNECESQGKGLLHVSFVFHTEPGSQTGDLGRMLI